MTTALFIPCKRMNKLDKQILKQKKRVSHKRYTIFFFYADVWIYFM